VSEEKKEQADGVVVDGASEGKEVSPKRKNRRLPIIVGTVVVVLAIAGAGFWVWHEQPSFCGAICHTPMDSYLTTYNQEAGTEGVDKWGNTVENTDSMLAVVHKSQGLTCLSCHTPVISEQITEGLGWISGNYSVVQTETQQFVPTERNLTQLTAASGVASEQFCLKSGCHTNSDGSVMTRDDLVEKTSDMKRNPHSQPHGEVACTECHKAHRASTVYCSKCHTDADIPDGWISYSESEKLQPTEVTE
jgi:hypothetical protein